MCASRRHCRVRRGRHRVQRARHGTPSLTGRGDNAVQPVASKHASIASYRHAAVLRRVALASLSAEPRCRSTSVITSLALRTDRGVFSHGRLDPGPPCCCADAPASTGCEGTLLDLGCGSGALALALARWRRAATVWAVDVNERARQLTAANAAANGIGQRGRRRIPTAFPATCASTLIWSNPPIRIGKPALHELAGDVARPTDAERSGRARRPEAPRCRLAAALAHRRRAGRRQARLGQGLPPLTSPAS